MDKDEIKNDTNIDLEAKKKLEELEEKIDASIKGQYEINPASFYSRLQDPEVKNFYNTEVAIRSIIRDFLTNYNIEEIEQTIERYKTINNFRTMGIIRQEDFENVLTKYGFKYEEFIFLGRSANNYVRNSKYKAITLWTEEEINRYRKLGIHTYNRLLPTIERLCQKAFPIYPGRVDYEYQIFGFNNTAWYQKFYTVLREDEECKVESVATWAIDESSGYPPGVNGTQLVAIKRALEETIAIWENLSSEEIRAMFIRDCKLVDIDEKNNRLCVSMHEQRSKK